MEGIGELGFRVRAAGDRVDERTFRPWAVAAGLWAVFFVREQKKGVGCVFRSGRRQALHRAALPTRCSARIRTREQCSLN